MCRADWLDRMGRIPSQMFDKRPYDVSQLAAVQELVCEASKELMVASQRRHGPDDGALLESMRVALLQLGISEPSFSRDRLSTKPARETVPCVKIMALCPMKSELLSGRDTAQSDCLTRTHGRSCWCGAGEDLEGDSKSGQALRAASTALGLSLSGAPAPGAPYPVHVLWRNLRGSCWRKKDVSVGPRSGTAIQRRRLI